MASCDQLLSYEAVQLYITKLTSSSTVHPAVWLSLSETLIMLLYHNICSSPAIEALWLCRIDELNDNPAEKSHVSKQSVLILY